MSTVYLLHFSTPLHHARHYLGWAKDLQSRLSDHQSGHGSHLTIAARAAGIEFQLARTWPGGRNEERKLKRRKASPRLCPVCKGSGIC